MSFMSELNLLIFVSIKKAKFLSAVDNTRHCWTSIVVPIVDFRFEFWELVRLSNIAHIVRFQYVSQGLTAIYNTNLSLPIPLADLEGGVPGARPP